MTKIGTSTYECVRTVREVRFPSLFENYFRVPGSTVFCCLSVYPSLNMSIYPGTFTTTRYAECARFPVITAAYKSVRPGCPS